jgi:hypothetical protein
MYEKGATKVFWKRPKESSVIGKTYRLLTEFVEIYN